MFLVADEVAVGDAGLIEDDRLRSASSLPLTVTELLADDLVRRNGSRDLTRGGDWGLIGGTAAEGIVRFVFGTAAIDGLLDEGGTLELDAGVAVDVDVVRGVDGDRGRGAGADTDTDAEVDAVCCCFSV